MYARSPSPSKSPAPTTIASRSPLPLGLCLARWEPRLARWEHKRPPGGRGALEEMKTRGIRGTFYTLHHSYVFGRIVLVLFKLDLIQNYTMVRFSEKNSTNWTSLFYKLDPTNWFHTEFECSVSPCSFKLVRLFFHQSGGFSTRRSKIRCSQGAAGH